MVPVLLFVFFMPVYLEVFCQGGHQVQHGVSLPGWLREMVIYHFTSRLTLIINRPNQTPTLFTTSANWCLGHLNTAGGSHQLASHNPSCNKLLLVVSLVSQCQKPCGVPVSSSRHFSVYTQTLQHFPSVQKRKTKVWFGLVWFGLTVTYSQRSVLNECCSRKGKLKTGRGNQQCFGFKPALNKSPAAVVCTTKGVLVCFFVWFLY